jgi:hypothetical protein
MTTNDDIDETATNVERMMDGDCYGQRLRWTTIMTTTDGNYDGRQLQWTTTTMDDDYDGQQ